MFLHLGHNISVRARDVMAIYDTALFAPGAANHELLKHAQAAGRVMDLTSTRPPASLLLTEQTIYLTSFAPITLLRRMRNSYKFVQENAKTAR